jgi:hypothetical protein
MKLNKVNSTDIKTVISENYDIINLCFSNFIQPQLSPVCICFDKCIACYLTH